MPGVAPTETASNSAAGTVLRGTVHGGQNPIVGAHVYLFAASTGGDAGPGIPAASYIASVSLLNGTITGHTDSIGGYVLTDSNGNFTITGDYVCVANSQVYLYALGGNPGGGMNSAAGLMASLGNCPVAGNLLASTPYIVMNEVSTVAAAYALAGYATDATHVASFGAAYPLSAQGIANAFANAANLETLSTGVALATTPAGNGTVPQSEIDTLANILAACINSAGPTFTPCTTLFSNAMNGSTAPTDTATAAINIAQNPGANIAALYALPTGTPPFSPALTSQPFDFTIALSFTGGGINSPFSLAVDGAGNVWMVNGNNSVTKMNGVTGAAISPPGGYTGNRLNSPFSIAIDSSGNAWVANVSSSDTPASVSEFTSSGAAVNGSPFTGGGLNNFPSINALSPRDVAIDASGNVWIANLSGSVSEFNGTTGAAMSPATTGYPVSASTASPSGVAVDGNFGQGGHLWVSGFNGDILYEIAISNGAVLGTSAVGAGGMQQPYSIAIDSSNNVWMPDQYDSQTLVGYQVSKFTSVTSGTAFGGGGILGPDGVAIDGGSNIWISNEIHVSPATTAGLTEIDSSGVAVSPATGYISSYLYSAADVGVDGSGNVWVASAVDPVTFGTGVTVIEFVGAAVPVVTPLATAVSGSLIASRPGPVG